MYRDDQAAARGLLIEATGLLNVCAIDYAIVGGWLPYLFNSAALKHPGTFDVDVLLNERMRQGDVVSALDSFRAHGYRRAAKNRFQLFRTLRVDGEDVDFHVDFLHRKYAADARDTILDWGPYQSISGPGADVVFFHNEKFVDEIEGMHPTEGSKRINITFCSEPGFLSTKGRSISFGKRTRDAYDVFLVVFQSRDRERLVRRSADLLQNPVFAASMRRLHEEFTSGRAPADALKHYLELHDVEEDEARRTIVTTMERFFLDVGVEE